MHLITLRNTKLLTQIRGYIASENSRNLLQLRQAQVEPSESYFTLTMSLAKASTLQMERGSGTFAAMYPPVLPGGRPRKHEIREILNGIFYVLRSGCSWRMLPHDFPPWNTVYYYFNRWAQDGSWQVINDELRIKVRVQAGKSPEPSAGIIDSQSVKTTDVGGVDGYDAGKKVTGRKRYLLVDTLGLVLTAVVHSANIQNRDGVKLVFKKASGFLPRLQLIWADAGYAGQLINWVSVTCQWFLEIVKRPSETRFVLIKKRWIVERILHGWENTDDLAKTMNTLWTQVSR